MFQLYFLFQRDDRWTESSSIWKPGYCPPLLTASLPFSWKMVRTLASRCWVASLQAWHLTIACLAFFPPYAAEQNPLISGDFDGLLPSGCFLFHIHTGALSGWWKEAIFSVSFLISSPSVSRKSAGFSKSQPPSFVMPLGLLHYVACKGTDPSHR